MLTRAVILAAGQGTRMRSKHPKVLHLLSGRPLIAYSIETTQLVTGQTPVLVVGHAADQVRQLIGDGVTYVHQEPQLGTGHALRQVEASLRGQAEQVMVIAADMPLWRVATLSQLVALQSANQGPISMVTVIADDPRGFGRVVRDASGRVQAIVEEAHATAQQLAVRELNTSAYCFDANWLWGALSQLPVSPKGEYYLTDLVGMAVSQGLTVEALVVEDPDEAIGINSRLHLAQAEAILRQRVNQHWMEAGVTMIDPDTTYIERGASIGRDTIIYPNTHLLGSTIVGEDCYLGPGSVLRDANVGNRCVILASIVEKATLEDDVQIGPYAHLRKGAYLASGVHMGNFGEVKNSYLGAGVKMGHFSYIGDATIGAGVNIGAGTITCNYDGEHKHPTEIGEGAFIGSDTMLVAPVKIGAGSRTGAGSVVTKDVAPDTVVVGVPARAIRKRRSSD